MRQCTILALLVLIYLTTSLALGQEKSQSMSSKTSAPFAIQILDENWDSLRLGYTSEGSWPILQRIYKDKAIAEVTSLDIARYDWRKQQIILNLDAGQVLRKKFNIGVNKRLSENFGILHRAFVVTVDGQPTYGGIFIEHGSQMAIDYPVIYISQDKNGVITMDIRPVHSIFHLEPTDPKWRILRQDRIYDIFAGAGKLTP
jgi:hypothetical protein